MHTITVTVSIHQMEPGTHFCKKILAVLESKEYTLPRAECSEPRPDWGEYSPIVTHPAIERVLRRMGAFTPLPADQQYFFGVKR